MEILKCKIAQNTHNVKTDIKYLVRETIFQARFYFFFQKYEFI